MYAFEERLDGVTVGEAGGLGYAWVAPLISAVVGGQQQASTQAGDVYAQAQYGLAQRRAEIARSETVSKVITGVVLVGILGLGGWVVYRGSKSK